MSISVFDLFSIGIGPSSSHTVGPMIAAKQFVESLESQNLLRDVTRLVVTLHGSLAYTGKGHGTDNAIIAGLTGDCPETVSPDVVTAYCDNLKQHPEINILGKVTIPFNLETDLIFEHQILLPKHTNGMQFTAMKQKKEIAKGIYYSVGGGFVVSDAEFGKDEPETTFPYPFTMASELLDLCKDNNMSIAELMMANEQTLAAQSDIEKRLLNIADVMKRSIEKGCITPGHLPGPLNVRRRAPALHLKLQAIGAPDPEKQADMMNWLNLYAIAVNEENAAGGRVVTAPTNGAAGIIPSVLNYYTSYHRNSSDKKVIEFLLTAGAIAILYKKQASISGAEVGCQGEVGVASSMAAGALTAVLGGTLSQVENAAEIAMEHHLGMTCDPVAGLVQIPCIERNAMGAVKAVNAARLALMEDGQSVVSLDKVINTMRQTGHDMMTIYKETSLGGLAVNVPEC